MIFKSLHHKFVFWSGNVSLATVLIVPFVLQMFVAVGLVGYFSFCNGQQVVENLVGQLQQEIGNRVELYLTDFLSHAELINQLTVDAVNRGELNLDLRSSIKARDRYLYQQIQYFPAIAWISLGSQQGDYLGVTRKPSQTLQIVAAQSTNFQSTYYGIDSQGNRTQRQDANPGRYDPRQRPWYKAGEIAKKPVWSKIYPGFTAGTIFISISQPIYNQTKLQGVVAANISLSSINKYLTNINVSRSGKIFIMERSGLLVSSSTSENPLLLNPTGTQQRRAIESKVPLIRETTRAMYQRFSRLDTISQKQQIQFTTNGRRQFVQVLPLGNNHGIDWLIVIVVPESDFMGKIETDTQNTIILCIAALSIATIVGTLTAQWLTKPILQLNTAAKEIAKGNWEKTIIQRSDEVGELAKSFNHMVGQLQESFAKMQELNEALSQSESRLTQFLEALPVGISIHTPDSKVVYFNQAARHLLQRETIPEATWEQLAYVYQIHIADTEQLYPTEHLPALLALKGKYNTSENLEIWQEGKKIPIEIHATPIFDIQGNITYAIAAFKDITDRKQIEKLRADYNRTLESQVIERTVQLADANAQLKQKITASRQIEVALAQAKTAAESANSAKSIFLANMSHELRTPLNTILGFSQLLAEESNPASQLEALSIIDRSGTHLLSLINDILEMSKIEADRVTLHPSRFDLYAMLFDLEKIFQLQATAKGLQLIFKRSPDVPQYVQTDANKLRQILINLLVNAIKFTARGHVTLGVKSSTNTLIFEVEDTGAGIDSTELKTLFTPFGKTATGVLSQQGTGLGLFISRKYAQLMAGDITIKSTVNVGTIVELVVEFGEVEASQEVKNVSPENKLNMPIPQKLPLEPADLQVMSTEWLDQLHHAAIRANAKKILQLVELIPIEHSTLRIALTDLVNSFRFDLVMESQQAIGRSDQSALTEETSNE